LGGAVAAATKRRPSSSSGVRAPAAVGRLQTHKNRTEQERGGEGDPPRSIVEKGGKKHEESVPKADRIHSRRQKAVPA
jgi:hypothetical protein